MFLWELIKSLTVPEKRRFMQRGYERKRKGHADYVLLFKAIEKQEEYDEDELLRKHGKKSFTNNLPRAKNYLYHKILDAVLDAKEDDEATLQGYLGKVKALLEKGLTPHVGPILPKAKALAEQMEDFNALKDLIRYEQLLLLATKQPGDSYRKIENLFEIDEILRSKEQNLLVFRKFLMSVQRAFFAIGEEKQQLKDLVHESPVIKEEYPPASNVAKSLFYFGQHLLSFMEGKFEAAIRHSRSFIAIFEDNPRLLSSYEHFVYFVTGIYNLALIQIRINQLAEAKETMDLLRKLAKADKRAPVLTFEKESRFSIAFARKSLDYELGHQEILKTKDQLREYSGRVKLSVEIEIIHLAGIFYLNMGKPKLAVPWIVQNSNRTLGSTNVEMLAYSKILFLVAHYELGNVDMVERGIRSAEAFYGRHKRLRSFERTVLRNFKLLLRAKTEKERWNQFTTFETEVQEEYQQGFAALDHYFNLPAWIRSKIENSPMAEILKQEFGSAKE